MKTLKDFGEDAVVERLARLLKATPSVIAGAGDDCAVVRAPRKGCVNVLKTDAVIEGVHFQWKDKPGLVGRKAIARVISDFAAMGATPRHALVTLVCPKTTELKRLESVYRGMQAIAERFGIAIVGGELSQGLVMMISVAMEGEVTEDRWVGRGGGHAGDVLMVTGKLGGSFGGRHLTFDPRVAEGQWLAGRAAVHAMMDLSDGLAKDLPRLARASGTAFDVDLAQLPAHRGCTAEQAWGDGEDYELLLAVAPKSAAALKRAWMKRFPQLPLTQIGRLVEGTLGTGNVAGGGGWDHFRTDTA